MHAQDCKKQGLVGLAALLLAIMATVSYAETPQQFLDSYAQEAKVQNPNFKGFSAKAGESEQVVQEQL